MNASMFRCFPLVARPRPACMPLADRIVGLHHRAVEAARETDVLAATSVFNLAALFASDCGDAQLARRWCHRLATLTLNRRPGSAAEAVAALEPIVNLARLQTRAGEGSDAWTLLEALHTGVTMRADTTIDGILIPLSQLTSTRAAYQELRRWTWAVLLGSGAHALSVAGRWDEASRRLDRLNGVTSRMLDGRQIAVIAHILAGRREDAIAMLNETHRGEPWEQAVTACLRLLLDPADPRRQNAAMATYQAMGSTSARLAVFRTRLGLCLTDALAAAGRPPTPDLCALLLELAATDGYAARDVLGNGAVRMAAGKSRLQQLQELVRACALDTDGVPIDAYHAVEESLNIAEQVICPDDVAAGQAHVSAGQLHTQQARGAR